MHDFYHLVFHITQRWLAVIQYFCYQIFYSMIHHDFSRTFEVLAQKWFICVYIQQHITQFCTYTWIIELYSICFIVNINL